MSLRTAAAALVAVGAILCAMAVGHPAEARQDRVQHGSVSVSKSGSGSGRVVSRGTVDPNESAIDCGSTCSGTFVDVTDPGYVPVTLTASPDPGSSFDGWGGACSGSGGCTIHPVERLVSYSATATFTLIPAASYPVAVGKNGEGTVASAPGGIDCGSSCSASFDTGSSVTLSATPAAGWTFGGWSGACSGTGSCGLTIDGPKSVTATFSPPPPPRHDLTVARAGNGRVTSAPTGIDCGTTCSATYDRGTQVTLTATPDAGSSFLGWGGVCSGTGLTCVVSVESDRGVTASFGGATSQPLAVTVEGNGAVSSAPAGISCGNTCNAGFRVGTAVTLTAAPTAGSVFAGWTGACTGTSRTCAVTMSAPRVVSARFVEGPSAFPLVVSTSGRGSVTSTPAGIVCGTTCNASLPAGSTVTLAATPAKGWVLTRWLGACSGVARTCRVVLDGPASATAQFARLADRVAPRVRALSSTGRAGTRVRLRYRVTDASGRTREWATVSAAGRRLGTAQATFHAHDPDALHYVIFWRPARTVTPGRYRFCVRSADAAGNVAPQSCASVKVTP